MRVVHARARVSQGGYTGWVYRVGNREAIPGYYPATAGSKPRPAKRAPEGPEGLEWVGLGAAGVLLLWGRRRGRSGYHPCGARSVPPRGPSLYPDLADCRLLANNGEI